MPHAKFSPSAAHRWIECPGSISAESIYPESTSIYAEEGTAAHALNELGLSVGIPALLKAVEVGGFPVSDEMRNHSLSFVRFVLSLMELHGVEDLELEKKVELDEDIWGTADVILRSPGALNIIDYKYGKGVEVEAHENPQLAIYALAALRKIPRPVSLVRCYIYQPRISGTAKVWEVATEELTGLWLPKFLEAKSAALEENAPRKAGEHCKFCRAKTDCSARMDLASVELGAAFDDAFSLPPAESLTMDQRTQILRHADSIVDWLHDLKSRAVADMEAGITYPGFKLVEGRSNRRWRNEEAAANILRNHVEEVYKKSLRSVAEVEKEMGKKNFQEHLGALVEKPQGKPTLALAHDKRNSVGIGFD